MGFGLSNPLWSDPGAPRNFSVILPKPGDSSAIEHGPWTRWSMFLYMIYQLNTGGYVRLHEAIFIWEWWNIVRSYSYEYSHNINIIIIPMVMKLYGNNGNMGLSWFVWQLTTPFHPLVNHFFPTELAIWWGYRIPHFQTHPNQIVANSISHQSYHIPMIVHEIPLLDGYRSTIINRY